MDQQLVALYELKRQSFLIGYIQNPDHFSDALAFAYYHRLSPIFHEDIVRETYDSDPFEDAYAVKASFIDSVTQYVDECWRTNNLKAIEFYTLEEKFGGYKAKRIELLYTLEYARIDGRFDDTVWTAIESNAPIEASSVAATFSPKDVHFG